MIASGRFQNTVSYCSSAKRVNSFRLFVLCGVGVLASLVPPVTKRSTLSGSYSCMYFITSFCSSGFGNPEEQKVWSCTPQQTKSPLFIHMRIRIFSTTSCPSELQIHLLTLFLSYLILVGEGDDAVLVHGLIAKQG